MDRSYDQEFAMPRTLTLSFELLEAFVALIRSGGDAAQAMRALGINQPTMSKRLRYVQHVGPLLDRPWVVRQGKTWELTDEGKRVWPAVLELVERYENLQGFLGRAGEETGPTAVHFACGQQMVAGLVRQALQSFRKEHPQVALWITTLRGRARIEGVSNGALDLAIVTHDEPSIQELARRPLHVEPLASHRLVLVGAVDSPWYSGIQSLPKDGIPPEALARFPLILPERDAGIRKELDAILRHSDVLGRLTVALEIGGWRAILTYVRDGFGVGIVSEAVLADEEDLTIRPLDPAVFPPIASRLICRRAAGRKDGVDLSAGGFAWRDAIIRASKPSPDS
jgi:DNA-binding transcriptional LysR family regulator